MISWERMRRVLVLGVVLASGCRPVSMVAQPKVPTLTGEGTRCRNAAGQDQPLVTEWPASEKANLESQVRQGGVVVSFSGCSMTVLTQCHTREPYYWVRTTPSSDWFEIKNEDDLYAKLPLGAASLKGELKGSGNLTMQTTITGQLRLSIEPGVVPVLEGACDGATHIVGGLAIGAYQLDASGKSNASVEGSVKIIGSTNATSSASKQVIRHSGDAASCASSTDQAPAASCSSPVQMFLLPVKRSTLSGGGPGATSTSGAIEVQLSAAEPEASWDVVVDGHQVCTTPCSHRLAASSTLLMRERTGLFTRTSRVTIPNLLTWAPLGGVQVKAHKTSTWNVSGLARAGGILYGLIGAGFLFPCISNDDPTDRSMSCTVSGISFGFGVGLFALGTWVLDAPGHVDTSPLSGSF